MLSVQNDTTEYNSAKKTARQGNHWVFPVVLFLAALILALGAVLIYRMYAPTEYSEREVNEYVRDIYGDSWKLQKKTPLSDEKGSGVRYLYAGGNGGSFSVFAIPVPSYKDGKATGGWEKALSDNYFSTVIEKKMDQLKEYEKATEKEADLRFEIEKTGEDSGIYGATYTFRMYLETSDGFTPAAQLLEKIDSLFSFSCKKGTPPYDRMRGEAPSVRIYLKPEKSGPAADAVTSPAPAVAEGDTDSIPNLTTDWSAVGEREKYRISTISFTDATASSRLQAEDVFTRIENDYVDIAKTTGRSFYAASTAQRDKYPSPVLTLVNVGGHELAAGSNSRSRFSYQFLYHRGTGTYWLSGLDPCEDFDGNPFGDYDRRGAFATLVEYLGGSYSCQDWQAKWKIGENQWTASATTRESGGNAYSYQEISLFRNGNHEFLDEVPELFAGTGALPSGRPYSIRDLIRMLDVRITINQRDMTAVMFRNF